MIDAAADAGARGNHHHDGHLKRPGAGPADVPGKLEQIDDVEGVIAKLNFEHRLGARQGESHRRPDNSPFVQGGVPGGFQSLGGGEDAAKRRPDILAEDVGHAQVGFAVVEGHPHGLDQRRHDSAPG